MDRKNGCGLGEYSEKSIVESPEFEKIFIFSVFFPSHSVWKRIIVYDDPFSLKTRIFSEDILWCVWWGVQLVGKYCPNKFYVTKSSKFSEKLVNFW